MFVYYPRLIVGISAIEITPRPDEKRGETVSKNIAEGLKYFKVLKLCILIQNIKV